ncbi:MAG TPA: 2-oxoglutarate dehydrogenase complex dihydrolipoyllysine-residue succinyltransferase [Phycisphaerales bacterium]|jgi:2-oxoglutarate dehydrogenase E2 component (dihydrolipoamide succinyltransferase)|nr:2-oxoglutarate dehydrogenase complex dihydrolipoyllysine-residue succinyltransferase [Phycisphaerales bacterium]
MAVDIVIPQAGESVTSGVISRWIKNDGDYVKRDEDVLELETDKVTMGVPAPASGVLKVGAAAGETVSIGQKVGAIDDKASAPAGAAKPAPASPATANGRAAPAAPSAGGEDVRATPLARKLADEHGVSLAGVHGSGAGGRIREQDVQSIVEAKGKGGGALVAAQVAAPSPARPATSALPSAKPEVGGTSRRERMSPLRQRIAARLVEAQHTAAMLTTFNECDMSAVMALRSQYKEAFEKKNGVGLGFMSFFVKAVVGALRSFPTVNASIVASERGEMEVEHHDFYDVAVAVGTPKGLVVPVLRGCDRLSFAQIEAGIKDLAVRAKDGKLALSDLQGGTFTITNGGIYGSLMSTPILNPPQTGILGMHAIKNRPIEDPKHPGQIVLRPMMYLALSYDHRLVDGAEAVQFLVAVKNAIEDPQRLLIGL